MKTKTQKPYILATVADKTGTLDLKRWDASIQPDGSFGLLKAGELVSLEVRIDEYNGKMGGEILFYSAPAAGELRSDYMKASEYDPDKMWAEFREFLDAWDHPYFSKVANSLFDAESVEMFQKSPAATGMHHAFFHGLLEHTLQMLQMGKMLLAMPFFHELNKDLCMFGLMFHDFGKIYEYSCEAGFKKKTQGILVPHIPMVAARILEAANQMAVPEAVRDHMMHVVLAHHRLLEWGSPVKFACPEAAFVHYVDNLHGDVFGILQKRAEATEETVKYGYFEQAVTILSKSFNTIIKECEGVADGF